MAVICGTAPCSARIDTLLAPFVRLRLICQPEAGQRYAREAGTEFLQRRAARDRLSQAFSEFIESVVHTFPFVCWFVFVLPRITRLSVEHTPGIQNRESKI
jgi:hypothetical protein